MSEKILYSKYIELSHPKILKYNKNDTYTFNNNKKDEYVNTNKSATSNEIKTNLNKVSLYNKIQSFLSNKIKSKSSHYSKIRSNNNILNQALRKLNKQTPFISSYSSKNSTTYKNNNYSHKKFKSSLLTDKKNENLYFLKENYILMKPFSKFDERVKLKIRKELFNKKKYIDKKNYINETKKGIKNIDVYSMTNKNENKCKKLFDSLIKQKEIETSDGKFPIIKKSHIKLGSEGILTDIILKKRKVINCINSRLCFPFLMNDENIMNHFSKSRKINTENNFL